MFSNEPTPALGPTAQMLQVRREANSSRADGAGPEVVVPLALPLRRENLAHGTQGWYKRWYTW